MADGPIRTVIVDDVDDLRFLVRLTLEHSGDFQVVGEAIDGEEAIARVAEARPELVLLDVAMPVKGGLEALPEIKSLVPEAKVVVLSGFQARSLAQRAIDLGATGYIEKGIPPRRLVQELLAMVRGTTHAPSTDRVVQASPAPAGETEMEASSQVDVEELLSFVAREIRNPLTVVQGLATALEMSWDRLDREQAAGIAARIAANSRYLDGVVKSIFLLGAHSADVLVERVTLGVEEMMKDITGHLRDVAPEHPLDTEIHPGLPAVIVDPDRFRQVLTYLVANAVRYSARGTPVLIRARRDLDTVVVEVFDNGPGFPRDQIPHAFDKFTRFHESSGLGLGLYISRRLMTAMDGEIWIKNQSTGAVVACRLPAAVPG